MFSPRLDLVNNPINHVIYFMLTTCGIKLMTFHISLILQPHGKAVKSRKDLDVRAPPAKVGTRLANVARRGRSLHRAGAGIIRKNYGFFKAHLNISLANVPVNNYLVSPEVLYGKQCANGVLGGAFRPATPPLGNSSLHRRDIFPERVRG